MNNCPILTENEKKKRGKAARFFVNFKKSGELYLMILLPLAYILLFYYTPMYGLQIAFRDYKARSGIWGSAWVGLKHFNKFFAAYNFKSLLGNTLIISFYNLFAGFPIPIILALVLHVNEHKALKKITQNLAYMPHFISTVVLVGILNQLLNPVSGVYGTIYHWLGGTGQAVDIRSKASAFRHLFVWSGIWQNMGWSTIIYISALSSVSQDLHEAAKLDGANRWQRVLHVDIPSILPTVCIMLILRCGHIMSVGYEKVLLMQNDLNLGTSEVISTYVYKTGMTKMQMSYATAVDLFNSLVNAILLITVNGITRTISDGEQGLF